MRGKVKTKIVNFLENFIGKEGKMMKKDEFGNLIII